jgi:FkbM family methyltransferase
MPYSHEEHVTYTNKEYRDYSYYQSLFNILKNKNIQSYIDIGANVGEVCNIYFDTLPTLKKAYLFEVEVSAFNFLNNNIKYPEKVQSYNLAIYYGSDPPKLFKNFNTGGGVVATAINNNQFTEFDTIKNYSTLEQLNLPLVDLIKMDIEGGEYDIIKYSKFLHSVKYLEIEFHYDNLNIEEYIANSFPNHNIILAEDIKGRFLFESKYL